MPGLTVFRGPLAVANSYGERGHRIPARHYGVCRIVGPSVVCYRVFEKRASAENWRREKMMAEMGLPRAPLVHVDPSILAVASSRAVATTAAALAECPAAAAAGTDHAGTARSECHRLI